jgi:hypothetical protein
VPIFGSCTYLEFGKPLLATPPTLYPLFFTAPGIEGCLEVLWREKAAKCAGVKEKGRRGLIEEGDLSHD